MRNSISLYKFVCISALITLFSFAGCSGPGNREAGKPGSGIFVSIPPQEYFAERLSGGLMPVRTLVQPGQSPHSYQPTPRQMEDLAKSAVYFRIGVPFEDAVIDKIKEMNAGLKIIDIRDYVDMMDADDEHAGHDEHDHGELDPHIWMDPMIMRKQADIMCDEMIRLEPDHEEEFRKNLAALHADLDSLDKDLAEALAPLKGRKFYVFHPAFGYFGRAYGLEQVAVETGGKEPSAKQLASLVDKARADGIKVIFVQAQFPSKSADAVAEAIGGAVVLIDPLARDYIANMRDIADKLKQAL